MSTLKELLKDVPVEWKALGKITRVLRGRRLTKNQLSTEGYPVYHGGLEPLGYYDSFNRPSNSVMIINVGASAGNVGISPTDFWSSDGCYCLQQIENIYSKYLFYFLLSQELYLKSKVRYAGIPTLDAAIIDNVQFPIPFPNDPQKSLAIQQEIVRILDSLSEQNKALTTALANEIDNRKKQYAYYREELFRFEGKEVEWKTLGKVILKSYSGSTPKAGDPKYYQNGTIPWLRTQEVKFTDIEDTEIKINELALKETATKWIPENCLIIAISGATAGRSAINKIPLTTNQHCLCLEINPQAALYRYVFHWVSYNYENIKSLGQGARGDLNSRLIKNYKIPIPSLEEQERIVRLLDQFDEATKSIVAELEKEIELRNKQYEYYRNQLLMFNG